MSRPRKTTDELKKTGSRNVKVDQLESGELVNPLHAPGYLEPAARRHWEELVPKLVDAGVAKEADRTMLAVYCADLARFHENKHDSDGEPLVDEKERSRIGERLRKTAEQFGLTPLSRQRSGINAKNKKSLIEQR
jgi:P27 family predicted phage terminase small subunit